MDDIDIKLREWAPLSDLLDKIPIKIQKGILPADVSITCVDVIPEFIALGTNAGVVFWYNRTTGEIEKLRTEVSSSISCVKIVSTVEYMLAAGSTSGVISVFQIQKEIPPDLNLVAPSTKTKPIYKFTIRESHKAVIRCIEWSKNGMKLFTGDKNGAVFLTEFDYQALLSKTVEVLNESFDIVQLSVYQNNLLVSTLYRTVICRLEHDGRWNILQVGVKDRKILSEFGATFMVNEIFKLNGIIACRPGLKIWLANLDGTVEKTLIFKDSKDLPNTWQIPLLNPSRNVEKLMHNFSIITSYCGKLAVTYDETVLCILNLEMLRIEAIARGFRNILNISICGKEIFVLEGSRSLIRLAPTPEPPSKTATIIFNPLLPPPVPQVMSYKEPIEYESAEEFMLNVYKTKKMPPIESLNLDIPVQVVLDSPRTEINRRIEIFNEIGKMDFDETILYGSVKKDDSKKKKKKKSIDGDSDGGGIVEIGQAISEQPTKIIESPSTSKLDETDGPIKLLTNEFDIEPVILTKISDELLNQLKLENERNQPYCNSPSNYLNYPFVANNQKDNSDIPKTPRKSNYQIYNIENDNNFQLQRSNDDISSKPLKFISYQPQLDNLPKTQKLPEHINIPILKIQQKVETDSPDSQTSSEWEFIENEKY